MPSKGRGRRFESFRVRQFSDTRPDNAAGLPPLLLAGAVIVAALIPRPSSVCGPQV